MLLSLPTHSPPSSSFITQSTTNPLPPSPLSPSPRVPMGFPQEMPFSGDTFSGGASDDFLSDERNFSGEGIEWLSAFVEDCFSGGGSGPVATQEGIMVDVAAKPVKQRSKRRSPTGSNPGGWFNGEEEEEEEEEEGKGRQEEEQEWDKDMEGYDPPLLDQAYWLADSELIVQKKIKEVEDSQVKGGSKAEDNGSADPALPAAAGAAVGNGSSSEGSNWQQQQQQPRRCSHCLAQRTPQWRAGPLGPKTLCNACGVRFKSGRLLPEYRPAKSPTFVSYKHSNSHKKVMEMRMSMSVAASD